MTDLKRTYWNMEIEPKLNSPEMRELQWRKLTAALEWQYENTPMHRERFDQAGVTPTDIRSFRERTMTRTVAVTGVNSYFASTLLPRLQADPEIDRIVGIDVTPWKGGFRKVDFHRLDIRSEKMAEALTGVDALYHLAFVVAERHDKKETHDIFMGDTALKLPHGVSRQVTREQAHVDRAIEVGLVPMTGKVRVDNFILPTATEDAERRIESCV
jgi:hypothetical protein